MKMKYKFVDHTADVEFIAFGSSLEETFKNAFLALFDTASYLKKVSKEKSKAKKFIIREKARDPEQLLWYVLQDAVSIMDSKSLFAYRVSGIKILESKKGYSFNGELLAKSQKVEHSKLDVKGISRYGMKISKRRIGFSAEVVIDV